MRAAADVYALGLLLYLALCGRMPWHASTVTQMVRAHVCTSPSPMPVVLGLPPSVARPEKKPALPGRAGPEAP